jgi:RNA polymerase sigma factor (sigma-70 family)
MTKIDIEALIIKHDKLVRNLARKYHVRGYDEDDLYQEFMMVLLDCTRKFDPTRNVKFTTYLFKSIQSRLYQLIKKQPLPAYEIDTNIADNALSPDALDVKNEQETRMMKALDNIPNGYITKMILFDGMTLQHIGDVYGKSKVRILQIHRENLEKLQAYL